MSVSGKYLTALVNNTTILDNYSWHVQEGGDILDRTTGAFEGFEAEDPGVQNLHVTIKGYYDFTDGFTGMLQQGTFIQNVKLYATAFAGNPSFIIPLALVTQFSKGGEVKGRLEFSAEIHSRGAFTDTGT